MKRYFILLFILAVLLITANSFAQVGAVTWALSSSQAGVSSLPTVTATAGAPTVFFTNIVYNTTWAAQPYGCEYGSATGWPAGETGQVAGRYVEFKCTVKSGQMLINSVTFDLAAVNGKNLRTLVYWSKDNFTTNTMFSNTNTLFNFNQWYPFAFLIGAPAVSAGGTFSVRLYPYNNSGAISTDTFMGLRAMKFNITLTTGVRDFNQMPTQFGLDQNYPNPFNPTTTISYGVPQQSMVTLKVYDILGNEVATLVNEVQQAGNHAISFDASKLTSGVYIYRMQAGSFTQTKKMILLR
jgi:hypothetical protein